MLPKLSRLNRKSKQFILDFPGLNATNNRAEGEMESMKNLTSTYYPYIAPRSPRSRGQSFNDLKYIGVKDDKFFWIDGTNFYFDGTVKGTVTAGAKQVCVMNDYIIIFPDKVHYDVVNNKFEPFCYKWTTTTATFTKTLLTVGGADFAILKKGDAIKVTGCKLEYNNRSAIIKEKLANNQLEFDENTFQEANENGITIEKGAPDMDFVIEAENRLWGCKKNEIFASKLGDHTNFQVFAGLATDSYAASVGTDGPFTAAINYSNNIVFFKEDCIHRIFGSKPSNFQIITTHAPGVEFGSQASLAIANQVLFYKSRTGIMAYNGSLPEIVSGKLGYGKLGTTIAGSDGKKYYASIYDGSRWNMYVYDAIQNVWHKEDDTHATHFVVKQGVLYFVDAADKKLVNTQGVAGEVIDFEAELGPITEVIGEKKGYSKLQIRAIVPEGATLDVYVSHDGFPYVKVKTIRHTSDQMYYALIQIQRCDYFYMKFAGTGNCQIISVIREFWEGSDI